MKISLGCDEAAYQLKETIKQHLQEAGHEVIDNGVGEGEVELYPDVAVRTCKKVTDGTCDRGILVCGTGIGMAMTANKVPGIRAAVCHDPFSTERSILSNDANVMCMGARVIAPQLALYLLDIWMGLTFKKWTIHTKSRKNHGISERILWKRMIFFRWKEKRMAM